MIRHMRHGSPPRLMALQSILSPNRRESLPTPSAGVRIMQIQYGTARSMGYSGSAAGLLDADTNLSYAVPYLANAYRVAGGNENRAVSLYASGFYYHAKRKAMLGSLKGGLSSGEPEPEAKVAQVPAQPELGR